MRSDDRRPGRGHGSSRRTRLRELEHWGSSLGGARPKANFLDESGEPWIAKFPSREDRHDVGAWEGVRAAISRWRLEAADAGLPRDEIDLLADAFEPA